MTGNATSFSDEGYEILSTTRAGSSANTDQSETLLMFFSPAVSVLPSLTTLTVLPLLTMVAADSDECLEESFEAVLLVPEHMLDAGSWTVTEQTEGSFSVDYVCADEYTGFDTGSGLCTACARNPCGAEENICVPGANVAEYECDCANPDDHYLHPARGNRAACSPEFIVVFDLSLISGNTITLPFLFGTDEDVDGYPAEVLDFTVDWNDGSGNESYSGSDKNTIVSHTYASNTGRVYIFISGTVERFNFNSQLKGSASAFVDVLHWGQATLGHRDSTFKNCKNLVSFTDPKPPVNSHAYGLVSTYAMFYNCHKWNGNMSAWDMSNAGTLKRMFFLAKVFTGIGLENWDVSGLTEKSLEYNSLCDISPLLSLFFTNMILVKHN